MNEFKIMRILRESKDYSQEYVAEYLGISQNTYSKLENGQSRLTVDRMKQLAELYGVAPEYFLSNDLPVVTYNNGHNSHGGYFVTYNNRSVNFDPDVLTKLLEEKDKMIQEKENQIGFLKSELDNSRKERDDLLSILTKNVDVKI